MQKPLHEHGSCVVVETSMFRAYSTVIYVFSCKSVGSGGLSSTVAKHVVASGPSRQQSYSEGVRLI